MSSNTHSDYVHRVPPELFRPILQSIRSQADLKAVSLCCKDFCLDAQAQLFKKPFSGQRPAQAHVAFLSAVIASPSRLALYVSSYIQLIPKIDNTGISIIRRANIPAYAQLIGKTREALPLLRNLTHLELRPFSAGSVADAALVLQNTRFPRLERLDWWCPRAEAYLVRNVLPAHPNLKHLGVIWTSSTVVPPSLCKKLESLCGYGNPFVAFMRGGGRSITRIPWIRRMHSTEAMFPNGEQIRAHLALVKYLAYDFPGPEISATLVLLPNLEELELYVTSSGNAKSQLHHLEMLPRLTTLVITARDGFPVEEFLEEETHRDIASLAFSSCNTLEYIDIDSGWEVYSRYRAIRRQTQTQTDDSHGSGQVDIVKVEY